MDYTSLVSSILEQKKLIASPSSYISLWEKWYRGKVPSFHQYYVYNGQKKIKRIKKSMKMAKQVCEDWASLLMNEKVKIVVKSQDALDDLLTKMDFWVKSNAWVEKAFALSMAALVINLQGVEVTEDKDGNVLLVNSDKAYLTLGVHSAKMIVPITIENGTITECAFVSENTDNTTVVIHQLNEKKEYEITTYTEYKTGDKKPTLFTFFTGSPYPWFAIEHPRITNNLEIDSELPISIFANAIDTLMAVDNKYDSYDVEFQQGKKRTYVSADFNEVDTETGAVKNTFDPEDTVIYALPKNTSLNGESKNMVVNVTDSLRAAEHSQAIQDELNFLSKQVGLGVDYYRFEKGRVMTATQVISEKSDTFRNMKKHEGVLETQLISFIKALMLASNNFTSIKFDAPEEVEIQFDDSIIEDKTTEKDSDRKDVESGILSKLQFRMKWYGEDEETAKKNLAKAFGDTDLATRIATFSAALASDAITYEEFVNQVFPDKSEQEKAKIVEQLKEQGSVSADGLGLYNPTKDNE